MRDIALIAKVHYLEKLYGSMMNVPDDELKKLHSTSSSTNLKSQRGNKPRYRSKYIDSALSKLDTSKMFIKEVQIELNKDDKITESKPLSYSSVRQILRTRHLKYKVKKSKAYKSRD